MDKMFRDLEIIENWFNNGILNLDEYYKIKSNIVDFYKPKTEKKQDEELPF